MRNFCYRDSAGSPLSTNLQLYSLKKAQNDWNDLVKLSAEPGPNGVHDLIERLAFIVSCLGLSLSQLLGQNAPPSNKDKIDRPAALLSKILAPSDMDRRTRSYLNGRFQEFLRYYDSVRHFGKNKSNTHYQSIDELTTLKVGGFCQMTLEIWDAILEIDRACNPNNFRGVRSISEEVPFDRLAEWSGGSSTE